MLCTFDRSARLDLALVATPDLRNPSYIPLAAAPAARRGVNAAELHQLHTLANAVIDDLVAGQRAPLQPGAWEVLGGQRTAS